jgi:PAS domain S-box-containing protein
MADKSPKELRAENQRLTTEVEEVRLRLEEAEQALEAIRTGQAESLVVEGPNGPRIFSLESADHSYRVLVEAMNEGAVTLGDDGTVLYCNARFAEMLDAELERVMGSAIGEFVPDRSREAFEALVREAIDGESRGEMELISRTGRVVPAYLSASVIYDENRRRLCLVATDLREQKRNDETVAAEKLARAINLRKNEFLAALSHELRNPLTPIRNSLYILDRATPGSEQARRAKAVIDRQVSQLARLIDDLLDVTRITSGKMQVQRMRLELAELLLRTVEDHRSEFVAAGVELEVRAAPKPLWVNADAARIAQALGNLLQNAVKFTGRGEQVTLTLDEEVDTSMAVIRVRDTGIGIAPDVLPRLFQPFSQADSTLHRGRGGLGLGLSLVKSLIELHGGTVDAYSDGIGKGAEFIARIPLAGEETSAPRPGGDRAATNRRRVFIIEDNIDAADSLREALEFGEHQVEVVYNGSDAIAMARKFRPDVVLCDIGLPGMDGYEVARAFRSDETLKSACLVALTGYALPEDLQRAAEAGFDRHVAKPPNLQVLEQILALALVLAPH